MPFAVSWSSAAAYAVGLAVLFLLGRLLLKPLTWVLKLVCNALIGALLLFAVNFIGASFGFCVVVRGGHFGRARRASFDLWHAAFRLRRKP